MPSTVLSAATLGIDAYPVHVEVDTDRSLPTFTVVGLPDSTVRESKERVLAAIKNAGYQWPRRRVTVNLAPADRRKEGSAFDLPIALGSSSPRSRSSPCAWATSHYWANSRLTAACARYTACCRWPTVCTNTASMALIVPTQNAREAATADGPLVYTASARYKKRWKFWQEMCGSVPMNSTSMTFLGNTAVTRSTLRKSAGRTTPSAPLKSPVPCRQYCRG